MCKVHNHDYEDIKIIVVTWLIFMLITLLIFVAKAARY